MCCYLLLKLLVACRCRRSLLTIAVDAACCCLLVACLLFVCFVLFCSCSSFLLLLMHRVAGRVLSCVLRCALFVVRWSLYIVRSCNCVMCVACCCLFFAVGVALLLFVDGCSLRLSCVV